MPSAENDAPRFGRCSECPKVIRLTGKGRSVRHKRNAYAREYGGGPVWCEGSGIAPARVIPPGSGDTDV
jgi:hypothetical protein